MGYNKRRQTNTHLEVSDFFGKVGKVFLASYLVGSLLQKNNESGDSDFKYRENLADNIQEIHNRYDYYYEDELINATKKYSFSIKDLNR